MKTLMKPAICILLIVFAFHNIQGQEVALLSNSGYPAAKAVTEKPTAPASTEVKVVLKNTSEIPIIIFAGQKEDIRNPKVQTYGGLSKNTLYLQSTDVVCLMTSEPKIKACTAIKPGATLIEINSSGNLITCK